MEVRLIKWKMKTQNIKLNKKTEHINILLK